MEVVFFTYIYIYVATGTGILVGIDSGKSLAFEEYGVEVFEEFEDVCDSLVEFEMSLGYCC